MEKKVYAMPNIPTPSTPVRIDPEKCIGCKACMQIGCPAIAVHDKKARVDTTLCVGCDVCRQMCRFGALVRPDGRNA